MLPILPNRGSETQKSFLENARAWLENGRERLREVGERAERAFAAVGERAGHVSYADAGIEYVCDWVNDEQPYPIKAKNKTLISVPYSIEVNDIPAFLDRGWAAETFYQTIVDQFDGLYEDGAKSGRVMAICLHPFLTGHASCSGRASCTPK